MCSTYRLALERVESVQLGDLVRLKVLREHQRLEKRMTGRAGVVATFRTRRGRRSRSQERGEALCSTSPAYVGSEDAGVSLDAIDHGGGGAVVCFQELDKKFVCLRAMAIARGQARAKKKNVQWRFFAAISGGIPVTCPALGSPFAIGLEDAGELLEQRARLVLRRSPLRQPGVNARQL
jgi:hypothetical protein